jgi:Rrf2 family transcriptional regulator, iron-sulfur cluster assembly transcription factor
MKLSKKAEYALRAVVAMARDEAGRTYSIQEIATAERIPLKFLEQILLILKNGDILRSKRGVGGGYQLAMPAVRIAVGSIVEAIDGPASVIDCTRAVGTSLPCECGVIGGCAMGQTMAEVERLTRKWLKDTTVATIVERERQVSGGGFEI